MSEYRIKVIEDYYADFSHLDESEDEYLKNGPMMRGRIRTKRPEMTTPKGFSLDLYPFKVHGGPTRVGNWYVINIHQQWGEPTLCRLALPEEVEMTWDEYRETYGDANNYISFGVEVERKCEQCGGWEHVDSCWGFDFYLNPYDGFSWDPHQESYPNTGVYSVEKALEELPDFMVEHFEVLIEAKKKGAA